MLNGRLRRDHRRHRRRRRDARAAPRARRASGSCCSSAATGCRASRENWLAQDVFVDNRYVSEDTWYDENGKAVPAADPLLRRRRDQALRRGALPAAARRTSASCSTTTGSRRRGRSPTTSSSRTTRRPSSSTRCTARAARTRPSRPSSAPYPFPAVSHEPRIQQLSDDLEAAGYHPFHAPCGIRLNESNLPYSACVRCKNCDGFPCAVHGKSDAEVLGVRPALEHENVELLTNAQVGQARDERRRFDA